MRGTSLCWDISSIVPKIDTPISSSDRIINRTIVPTRRWMRNKSWNSRVSVPSGTCARREGGTLRWNIGRQSSGVRCRPPGLPDRGDPRGGRPPFRGSRGARRRRDLFSRVSHGTRARPTRRGDGSRGTHDGPRDLIDETRQWISADPKIRRPRTSPHGGGR